MSRGTDALHVDVPHLLNDGLLITCASDIHMRRGTYTVLVVIDAPRSEPRMEERLNELRLVIEKLGTHYNYSKCFGAAHPRHGGYDDTSLGDASQHTN